jgi:hypothetical protein
MSVPPQPQQHDGWRTLSPISTELRFPVSYESPIARPTLPVHVLPADYSQCPLSRGTCMWTFRLNLVLGSSMRSTYPGISEFNGRSSGHGPRRARRGSWRSCGSIPLSTETLFLRDPSSATLRQPSYLPFQCGQSLNSRPQSIVRKTSGTEKLAQCLPAQRLR